MKIRRTIRIRYSVRRTSLRLTSIDQSGSRAGTAAGTFSDSAPPVGRRPDTTTAFAAPPAELPESEDSDD